MKYFLTFLTVMVLHHISLAQQDDIKQPITNLFEGMRKSDSSLIRAAFAPGAIMQTVIKNKDSGTEVRTESVSDFITAVTKPHKEVYDERITYDVIKTDGDLAIAWTPYQFYIDNTFSHCGTDSFQLIKINGQWKIQYLIDTRRKQNCQ